MASRARPLGLWRVPTSPGLYFRLAARLLGFFLAWRWQVSKGAMSARRLAWRSQRRSASPMGRSCFALLVACSWEPRQLSLVCILIFLPACGVALWLVSAPVFSAGNNPGPAKRVFFGGHCERWLG